MQQEIFTPGDLLDANGKLVAAGFARRPLLRFNPENIGRFRSRWANRLRLKQWDYYGITTPEYFFSVCITDLGYMGLVFAYFIDFAAGTIKDSFKVTPLGAGCNLPLSSESGDNHFHSGNVKMSFLKQGETRTLTVRWPRFQGADDLNADLRVTQPATDDSIVMATPIDDKGFYYNHKANGMPTEGRFSIGSKTYEPTSETALCCLDWGRGVWPYATFWIWANASGRLPDGRRFGLNLGRGFGVLSAATENCFFIDGKMTKLGDVTIAYDAYDTNKPWSFVSDDGRLELVLTPFYHRKSTINLMVFKSKVNQMFGRYNGKVIDDEGRAHPIENLIGWAEDHFAMW